MGALVSAPLAMVGSCAGSLLASCCATAACRAIGFGCLTSSRAASASYIALMVLSVIASLSFGNGGGDIVLGGTYNKTADGWLEQMKDQAMGSVSTGGQSLWNQRFWCASRHPNGWVVCCEDVCAGTFSIYRFSFVLAAFFGTLALFTAGTTQAGAKAHRGFWFAKVFFLASLLVSSLFITNGWLEGYREFARYSSFLFLLLQILLLIDFAYTWNEKWLQYDEASEIEGLCGWKGAILVSSFALFAGSIAGWILLFTYFGTPECPAQQTLISVTLILCVFLTIVSCSKIAPHGTLLTSASVCAYATYLCYSALASHPDATCNPFASRTHESPLDLIVGLLVASITMASTAWNATGSRQALIGTSSETGSGGDMQTPLDAGSSSKNGNEGDVEPESWWYFHLMMVACSLYMAMLLTGWSTEPAHVGVGHVPTAIAQSDIAASYSVGLPSFWVKVLSQWVCLALYGWTLLAPYLLRDYRDFGIDFDF